MNEKQGKSSSSFWRFAKMWPRRRKTPSAATVQTSGSMICLGRSNYFRFNHPEEAQKMKDAMPNCRISCVPLHFLHDLENSKEYKDMIEEAESRSSRGSGDGRLPVLKSPTGSFRDSTDNDDFLQKVSKFEMISRKSSTSSAKSPGPRLSDEFSGSDSGSGAHPHVGEKIFTRDTATTRVSASVLHGGSSERVPSTCSTKSSSSLTSVSTLSWSSDSSGSSRSLRASSSSGICQSPHSPGVITSPIQNQTHVFTPPVEENGAREMPPLVNGRVHKKNDINLSGHRDTFDGIDFDICELSASQKDLRIRHQEQVEERKKEQALEKQERQRLEDILKMCEEYELQIEKEKQTIDPQSPSKPKSPETKISAQRKPLPPGFLEVSSDANTHDRKDRVDGKSSMTKIKTNGSLMLSSPATLTRTVSLVSKCVNVSQTLPTRKRKCVAAQKKLAPLNVDLHQKGTSLHSHSWKNHQRTKLHPVSKLMNQRYGYRHQLKIPSSRSSILPSSPTPTLQAWDSSLCASTPSSRTIWMNIFMRTTML
ncbi:uncharacterized protein LOC124280256 isoform X2 [Haliotis rubra]|uniref:uncharacterized protein LOC124280256 isoform X2 n=1 Tax=Haliotis rubra TaxID=36100 RepID=UPI001EE50B60|nr:uncharacterized protein LOC124280256 isoform X2 [Haliotis rubra]